MTKKEIKKQINKEFYTYVNKNFPEYYISDDGDGSCVSLIDESSPNPGDNSIDYHRSQHSLATLNWCSAKTKQDCEVMEAYLNQLVKLITSKAPIHQAYKIVSYIFNQIKK